MALQVNERVSTDIEVVNNRGSRSRLYTWKPVEEVARSWAALPDIAYVALVTERTTWRGKNGKRTTVELDRVVVKDLPSQTT